MTRPELFFRQLRRSIPQLEAEVTNKVIAVEAAKFHNENFRKSSWQGRGTTKWKDRKNKKEPGRALLVKSGRLRRAATTGRSSRNKVAFTLPIYGKVHNEGLRAGRGSGFTMTQRQFLGESPILKKTIRAQSPTNY